jgi:hypothetical protein
MGENRIVCVGLGRYREWKTTEFPPKSIIYEFGINKAER